MRSLARDFGWNTANQIITAISSLVVVPIALHRLGVAPYGVFTLAMSAVGLLQQLDGGMLTASLRYFGIAVGAEDRRTLTRQFISIATAVLAISCVVGAIVALLAPQIAGIFDIGSALHPSAVFATRLVAVLLPLGMLQGILQAMAQAHGKYPLVASTGTVCRVAFVIAVIACVHHGGLRTVLWLTLYQQAAITLAVLPYALGRLSRAELGWLGRAEFREMLAYSTRVQLYTISSVINLQADTLIIAAFLPVRDVAIYGTGATIATQLRSLSTNAGAPLVTRLSNIVGREGERAAFREFVRVQSAWGVIVGGCCAVAMGAAIFQVEAWLGPTFRAAGIICAILTAGNLVNLLTAPLTVYLQAIGRPEIEVRYGFTGALLNLALTFAFIWLGLYAIVAATSAGQIAGSVLLLWLARRGVSEEIPSFIRPVPWPAVAATAAFTALVAWLLYLLTPVHGIGGLALVSVSMVLGAALFLTLWAGPTAARATLEQQLRRLGRRRADAGVVDQTGV